MLSPDDILNSQGEILADERPSSLDESIVEGKIDAAKYIAFLQKEDDLDEIEADEMIRALYKVTDQEQAAKETPRVQKKRKSRTVKSIKRYYIDDNGKTVNITPRQSIWWYQYVKSPQLDDKIFMTTFRRRFRLPYDEFQALLNQVKSHTAFFGRWLRNDCVGLPPSPIELLLLGTLRYLGRGLTFDDLAEYTAISLETHRQFFHVFTRFGSTVLYRQYIKYPINTTEYERHRHEFNIGGLTGAGFSTDATNVVMWRCSYNLRQAHLGFKQDHPARSYNLSTNHRREILHTTTGHPARWNDKTLAHFDVFMTQIHESKILQDVQFELLSWEGSVGNSAVASTRYRGAWGLVDNGYHKWACTQAPMKTSLFIAEQRLSKWIESFRKDAECVFGILKGRFRILKTGIRVGSIEACDNIWLTCCALHNMLLYKDGLSSKWQDGVSSDWESKLGENDPEDMRAAIPFAIGRLNDDYLRQFGSRQHELQCQREKLMSTSDAHTCDPTTSNDQEVDENNIQADENGIIYVNSLSYQEFWNRLVVHFDILWRRRQIQWPRRHQNCPTSN